MLFLVGCTLDFRLKGYAYNHSITKLEKDYLEEAQKRFGKMPAAQVYSAGLKKYNRILNVEKVSRTETVAEFKVEKILLDTQFAQKFLDFLNEQTQKFPTRTSEEVLNEFLKTNPEPWPTRAVTTMLKIGQEKDGWLVQSEIDQ